MQELQTSVSRKLNDNWNMYYHLPDDKQCDLDSYKYIAHNIDTLEEIISINEKIPEKIVKHCMLFVMRKGITPMWEDEKNRLGGCFSYKVVNKLVFDVWKILCYSLCGETLCKDVSKTHLINGITISPKKNFCIVKIWLSDCSMQDPDVLIPIANLSKQDCLFKKHNPEF